MPGDGCAPDCKSEPICTGTSGCTSPCGDGLKLPDEECDDGNLSSGDGCSDKCKLEPNWECTQEVEGTDSNLVVPILYRDMMPQTAIDSLEPPANPELRDSRGIGARGPDLVLDTLGADRQPQYNPDVDTTLSMTTNADNFASWYHDSKYSKVVVDTVTLAAQGDGTFVFDNSGAWDRTTGTWQFRLFFPSTTEAEPRHPTVPRFPISEPVTRTDRSTTSHLPAWCATGSSTRAARACPSSAMTTYGSS